MASVEKEMEERAREKLRERYGDVKTLLTYKISPATVFSERVDYILECEFEERIVDIYYWNGNLYFFDEIIDKMVKKQGN